MIISMFLASRYNPPSGFIDFIRTMNLILGLLASISLLFVMAIPRWANWSVPTRLGWMALFMFCFTAMYGAFEIKFLDTYFRVPMVTVSLIWGVIAALWPRNKGPNGSERE